MARPNEGLNNKVTGYVSDELDDWIAEQAEARRVPKAELLREALEFYRRTVDALDDIMTGRPRYSYRKAA